MKSFTLCTSIVLALVLSACAEAPLITGQAPGQVKPTIAYIDLAGFDRELNASLTAKLPLVDIGFSSNVPVSNVPERMHQWLTAVEAGGGTVKVSPPASSVTAKNPLLLLSLVSGVWNSIKAARAIQNYEVHKPARTYDANIVLKLSEQGDKLIDKIIFTPREQKP